MLKSHLIAITSVVALVAQAGRIQAAELPLNLVNNPSLEEDVPAGGLPPGWGTIYSVPNDAYRATITDGGRTGKKQMTLEFVGNGVGQFGAMACNRVPLDPTRRYVARGWVKVAGKNATADVKLHYYAENGAYLGQTRIGYAVPGNDDWQLVTVTDHAADFPEAKRIGLAFACTGDAKAQYDDLELLAFDKAKLPADFEEKYGITLSPQMAILARRVGTWNTSMKIKPCVWVPNGLEMTGLETVRLSVNGNVLECRQKNTQVGSEQMSLLAYDARDRTYRSWFFDSAGGIPRVHTVGHWDKVTETFTFTNEPKDEFDSSVQMKFVGKDIIEWRGVWKDKTGKILLDLEGTAKRKSP